MTSERKIKIKIDDPKTRSIWGAVQWAKAEVTSWHPSKRGEDGPATKRDAAHDELARVVEAEDIGPAGLRKLALAALGDMPADEWQDSELWRNLAHTPELDYEVSCYLAAVTPSRVLALLDDLAMTRRDYCRERARSLVDASASDVAREMGWDDLDWAKHGE